MTSSASPRGSYHHGDLRNALLDAAEEQAVTGGPQAVSVRAAARDVGVTPTAAYRHFAGLDQLLEAVKDRAMVQLGASMTDRLRARGESGDRVERALGNLAALGCGYVDFALAKPGLFRTACARGGFTPGDRPKDQPDPFTRLTAQLDELAEAGYIPARNRAFADVTVWSAIHGLVMLILDGPLREMPADMRQEALLQLLLQVARGLGDNDLPGDIEVVVAAESRG
ncbi:TetR family transcriptional regulator [Amycolatopsis antarctica]|uniref:TetR family transcriptional regulator n=1 Tax=Amycolatopsis antarctica TaxID=1854586 RepID=A0A263D9W1_9PSEU|nr:TetR/AcrR family transcriptional regulator [Amycolatopsis antarctica]OZM75161.1 TetR family transcriptional regulator [Amycolatopsis antarctica]